MARHSAVKSFVWNKLRGSDREWVRQEAARLRSEGVVDDMDEAWRMAAESKGVDFSYFNQGQYREPVEVKESGDIRVDVDWVAHNLYAQVSEDEAPSMRAFNMWQSATLDEPSRADFIRNFVKPLLPTKVADDKGKSGKALVKSDLELLKRLEETLL